MIDLDVFLHGTLAGHIHSDNNDRFTFRYAQEYLLQGGIALSCSLPLRTEEFSYQDALRGWAILSDLSLRMWFKKELRASSRV